MDFNPRYMISDPRVIKGFQTVKDNITFFEFYIFLTDTLKIDLNVYRITPTFVSIFFFSWLSFKIIGI